MIYFVHATIDMYNKNIIARHSFGVEDFMEANRALIQRVGIEAKNIFDYELSHRQMCIGVSSYLTTLKKPQDVMKTRPYGEKISFNGKL